MTQVCSIIKCSAVIAPQEVGSPCSVVVSAHISSCVGSRNSGIPRQDGLRKMLWQADLRKVRPLIACKMTPFWSLNIMLI
jgi:hypothetical protein